MRPADILLSHGHYHLSDAIAAKNRGYSHASLVVAVDPIPMLIEAVPPVTRVIALDDLLVESKKVALLNNLQLSDAQRLRIVRNALHTIGQRYGLERFVGLGLDSIFDTQWFGDHLYISKEYQVCSGLVAAVYDAELLNFGVKAEGATPGEIDAFAESHPAIYQKTILK